MIYRNDLRMHDVRWLAEPNVGAGEILREFLTGERDLLEIEGGCDDAVRDLEPLPSQTLSDEEEKRRANLGANGPRDVSGLTMTHCVPDEHVVVGG